MDELLGARVPQDPQAEQAVIGAMLFDAQCIPDVLRTARPEHFYIQQNRDIFETISAMFSFGQRIDVVTVMEEMRKRGVFREGVTQSYALECMRLTPTAANVLNYVKILRDKALMRDLGTAARQIQDMVNEGVGEADAMLETAERYIYGLRNGRTIGGLRPISETVQEVYAQLDEMSAGGEQNHLPGLSTGLHDLDKCTMGLGKGELVLIASRPGMGKTSMALNIAMHAAKTTKASVAVFSLEMSREELALRLLSGEARIDSQKLKRGSVNDTEWRVLAAAARTVSETKLMIDDNPLLTVADMNAQCRRIPDLALVVVDYLQLMQAADGNSGRHGENRQQIVSDISRMFKIMAKDLSVPVLCLSQLSRANEARTDKRPVLSDLRESGAIEQDADIVIGLYRDGYYNRESENPYEAEAIVLKNRKGETGMVPLQWLPEYTTYVSAEWKHGEG
ncbi:MAG: replicative DNA helicase [Oscillospiraceae bacterium]|nr:replicative DNA helicase [Oscillospiraceae bacterium]